MNDSGSKGTTASIGAKPVEKPRGRLLPSISARDAAIASALFAGTLVLFAISFKLFFHGGVTFEFNHYAEIASNILAGRGLSSATYFPCELAYLKQAGTPVGEVGPIVGRFPLYPYWVAVWMFFFRGDFGMALANGVAHALWVVVVYATGRRLFDARIALVAAVLWAVHPALIGRFDLLGHPDVLFGAMLGALNLWYWRTIQFRFDFRTAAGLGLLAGLACTLRGNVVLWLPMFLALPLWRPAGWRFSAVFLAVFAVVVLPWIAYYLSNIGRATPPIFLWNLAADTVSVRAMPWMEYRTFALSDFTTSEMIGVLAHKGYDNLNKLPRDLPSMYMLHFLFPFALAGTVLLGRNASGLAVWLAGLLAVQAPVFSLLRYDNPGFMESGRYYLWIAPFIVLYAVAFLGKMMGRSKAWRVAGCAVLVAVAQLWVGAYLKIPRRSDHATGLPMRHWPEIQHVRSATSRDAWIMTNMPTQLTWHTQRRTISIPNRPEDVAQIEADWPVDYLLFTGHTVGEPKNFPDWTAMLSGRAGRAADEILEEMGFRFEKAFPERPPHKAWLFRKIRPVH